MWALVVLALGVGTMGFADAGSASRLDERHGDAGFDIDGMITYDDQLSVAAQRNGVRSVAPR